MTKLFQAILIVTISYSIISEETDLRPEGAALEIFQCNFSNGKDLDDTLKVASKWDEWADDNYSVPYAGYVMTPFYQTKTDFPFIRPNPAITDLSSPKYLSPDKSVN